MIAVTGASGHLGRLLIADLLTRIPANQIVAIARDTSKIADLGARGVVLRMGDYARPDTLSSALQGVDRLLLISSSEVGQRAAQHANVITAAKAAGVGFIAYTSLLKADSADTILSEDHKATEAALTASGLPHALLRNGWYIENYMMSVPAALEHGVILGAAEDGRISAAARADYAAAAAVVLTGDGHAGKVYELGGDTAFSMTELAATLAALSGKPVAYQNLPEADYAKALVGFGLPQPLAEMLADTDRAVAKGALETRSSDLSRLIGRPTTTLTAVLKATLA